MIFAAIWETDPALDPVDDATDELHGMLETRGLVPVGPPTWSEQGDRLSVTIPVLPEYSAAGSERPDTSLHALAGDLYDRWAA